MRPSNLLKHAFVFNPIKDSMFEVRTLLEPIPIPDGEKFIITENYIQIISEDDKLLITES